MGVSTIALSFFSVLPSPDDDFGALFDVFESDRGDEAFLGPLEGEDKVDDVREDRVVAHGSRKNFTIYTKPLISYTMTFGAPSGLI